MSQVVIPSPAALDTVFEVLKSNWADRLKDIESPSEVHFTSVELLQLLQSAGLTNISPQQSLDVFNEICSSNQRSAPAGSKSPRSLTVSLRDVLEWSDVLTSLHCRGDGRRTPSSHRDLLASSINAQQRLSTQPPTNPTIFLHPTISTADSNGKMAPRAETFLTPEFAFSNRQKEEAFVRVLAHQGFQQHLRSSLLQVRDNSIITPRTALASRRPSVVTFAAGTRAVNDCNRTIAFVNALCLRHVASGVGASMTVNAVLLFVDISGYSAFTALIEHQGAHTVSAKVNGYIEAIVGVIASFGGDVVKFAGDAILALWCEGSDKDNCLCGVMCAEALQSRHGAHHVKGTTLEFGIHCGLTMGQCVSRIFSPRKLRNNDMPSHFHFLSGEPLFEVGCACDLAKRGENVLHRSMLPLLGDLRVQIKSTSNVDYVQFDSVVSPSLWKPLAPSAKVTNLSSSMQSSTKVSHSDKLFVPPKVAAVLDSGMDQFFMAEMRELVVLFIHFAKTTDEEVWFDEVFHILESFGCDVVQIIDDDKGVHIVAALNLYAMAEHSVDAAINIALTMRAKHCDSHIGIAQGTVFCGVVGSPLACQWDIAGQACVRAARLMQHAVKNDIEVCFDETIFSHAIDRSPLSSLEPILLKGSPNRIPIYTLRPSQCNHRNSSFEFAEKVPTLCFHQSLCDRVHIKVIEKIRSVLRLKTSPSNETAFRSGREGRGSFDEGSVQESVTSSQTSTMSALLRSPKGVRFDDPPAPRTVKVVVLTGTFGTGKFCAAINALGASETIPVVHQCYERQLLVQLSLVHTIAVWFSFSASGSISEAADAVIQAFREHRQNEVFSLGIDLMEAVCKQAVSRFCIVVRAGQFLDQSSVSFVGAIAARFEQCDKLSCIVTCSPLYGFEKPETRFFAAAEAKVFHLESISDVEVQNLFAHCIKQKADNSLLAFVCKKTSKHVECVVELAKYLSERALLTLSNDGFARLRPRVMVDADALLWGDISPTIRRKAIHVLDHLTPQLLTFCKIIASITEQPLISAFFYSVNKVCQIVQNTSLDVGVVELLDSMWLLKLCEHKCTAHSGTGELDAAVFLVPAMRDIVQSLLVPQQRVAINKICGECFAETHPMNHPMQFLVRARHYLFAGMTKEYQTDFRVGFAMLVKDAPVIKDASTIRTRYFDWLRQEVGSDEFRDMLGNNDDVSREYEAYCLSKGTHVQRAHEISERSESRLSTSATQDTIILKMLQRLTAFAYPLELAPARPAYFDIIRMVQLIVEMVDSDINTANALILYEESSATVEGILDQLGASMHAYVTSLCSCLEGVVDENITALIRVTRETFQHFVCDEIQSQELVAVLASTTHQLSVTTITKQLVVRALSLVDEHLTVHVGPLCAALRGDSKRLIDSAHKISVAVRRRVHHTKSCALASAALIFQTDKGVVQGAIIASLFENLPSILRVYCGNSSRLQRIFCDGLREYYEGTLQPPETYNALGEKIGVFFFCWLNCCVQQLLFH